MSHRPGCPCGQDNSIAFYSACTCAAIEQREHTDALSQLAAATDRAAQVSAAFTEGFDAKERLAAVKADLAVFFALLDLEEETDEGRVFKPNRLGGSCRALDAQKMNELLARLKEFATS